MPGVSPPAGETREFAGFAFYHAAKIDADRTKQGDLLFSTPYERFDPARRLPILPFGNGPHVKLKLAPSLSDVPGAYVIADESGVALYVGSASVSLRQRWGPTGYGTISPRNCFRGGQATNVRINFLIGQALSAGRALDLWICESSTPLHIEHVVFAALRPPWTKRA